MCRKTDAKRAAAERESLRLQRDGKGSAETGRTAEVQSWRDASERGSNGALDPAGADPDFELMPEHFLLFPRLGGD